MHLTQRPCKGTQTARIREATKRNQRLEYAPGNMTSRAQMASTAVIPLGIYACNAADLSEEELSRFAAPATRAIWGTNRRFRNAEIVASWLYRGHTAFPPMALTYNRIRNMRRALRSNVQFRGLFAYAWSSLPEYEPEQRGKGFGPGKVLRPIGIMQKEFWSLGWDFNSSERWTVTVRQEPAGASGSYEESTTQRPFARRLPLGWVEESEGHVLHRLRAALRARELHKSSENRPPTAGAEFVHKRSVVDLLRWGKLKDLNRWTERQRRRMHRWRENQGLRALSDKD